MRILSLLLSSLVLVASLSAETIRSWHNSDRSRSITARFLSRDDTTVTLQLKNGRVTSFSIEKLSQRDQDFLNETYPLSSQEGTLPPGNAFDTLQFGDSKDTVEEKLLASSILTTDVQDSLFGRTGLNGIFRTKTKLGGLHCFLYFDWTKTGTLREVTLRTEPLQTTSYQTQLKSNWSELVDLLNKLYGKPISQALYPDRQDLQIGLMLASHLWRTDSGHSVLLGTNQDHLGYSVAVRFTTQRIQPVTIP